MSFCDASILLSLALVACGPPPPPAHETVEQLGMPYAQSVVTNAILFLENTLDWMADGALAACALARQP